MSKNERVAREGKRAVWSVRTEPVTLERVRFLAERAKLSVSRYVETVIAERWREMRRG